MSNVEVTNNLQTQQEEHAPLKHLLSTTSLDEQQLHLQQEQKAKGFLPSSLLSSSASSSLFLFPTTHNVTPLSDYGHSPPFFAKEQQPFHHHSHQYKQHSYLQPLCSENKNNQLLLLEEFKPQEHKPSSTNSLINHNQNVDLSGIPEEKNSLLSLYPLSDTIVEHNDNDNQSHLLTSTPILPSLTSDRPSTNNNNIFASLSSDKNNNNKPLPSTFDKLLDQSSSISTVNLITDFQHIADGRKLDNMSSLSSSLRHVSITSHPYDQRISDQGNKYIIQLKTDEYQENEFIITPRYSLNQLIVDAKHREEDSVGGFIHRELHKIFNIPKHIDLNQYAYIYNKLTQELTIEMPYLQTTSTANDTSPIHNTTEPLTHSYENRNNVSTTRSNYYNDSNNPSSIGTATADSKLMRSSNTAVSPTYESSIGSRKPFDFDLFHRSAFRPQIISATSNNNNNEKKIIMSLDLSDYQAEDIKVSVKDRELIVNAERKIETGTRKSRSSFFQSTSLPPQTDIEHLQTNYINGKVIIEAPYLDQNNTDRKIKTTTFSSSNN